MDLFGLENYGSGQQQYDPNSDSQVIFDETNEDLKEMDSEADIPMEISQSTTTDAPDEPSESSENDENESENDAGDVQLDINEQLKELNSLFKKKPRGKKATKTSTPVLKGKKGRQPKSVKPGLKFKSTTQVAGKTIAVTTGTIASIRRTRSDEPQQNNLQMAAPLGRRRSARLQYANLTPPREIVQQQKQSPRKNRANDSVEVIDLISAPPLVLPGVINLDSDDEDKQKQKERQAVLHELSFEDNYEISIKVRWNGKLEKHPLRKHQKFGDLIDKLAALENVNANQIILTLGESKIIQADDTPDTINYKITMILSGRSISSEHVPQPKANKKPRRDKNMIKVRLQAAGLKNPIEIYIDKTRKFASIRHQIAEALKIDSEKLKLKFDGDVINFDETPVDLDFDGGEMIDCETVK